MKKSFNCSYFYFYDQVKFMLGWVEHEKKTKKQKKKKKNLGAKFKLVSSLL